MARTNREDEMDEIRAGVIAADRDDLPETERRHPASLELDRLSTLAILELLNAEDRVAVDAAGGVLAELTDLVDAAAARLRRGGVVHYFGAGTSGRLGVLDAAELVPTFGVSPDLVRAHIAGGERAVLHAVEGSEDSEADGHRDAVAEVREDDIVIGITVSGSTPYVRGALVAARESGAATALITSNPASPLAGLSDHVIAAATGREVLTGSTRLKAGTATKILLNGFSTALMVRLGRAYSNLMVSVVASNQKLRERTLRILAELAHGDPADQVRLLDESGGDLAVAVVAAVTGSAPDVAASALSTANGSVRDAIQTLATP